MRSCAFAAANEAQSVQNAKLCSKLASSRVANCARVELFASVARKQSRYAPLECASKLQIYKLRLSARNTQAKAERIAEIVKVEKVNAFCATFASARKVRLKNEFNAENNNNWKIRRVSLFAPKVKTARLNCLSRIEAAFDESKPKRNYKFCCEFVFCAQSKIIEKLSDYFWRFFGF